MASSHSLFAQSPSPHGRVGTCVSTGELGGWIGRRPLMVGSEHFRVSSTSVLLRTGRRPLMVGSEQESPLTQLPCQIVSPSPHGRVGTQQPVGVPSQCPLLAVPSWSGRNLYAGRETSHRAAISRRPLMVGSERSMRRLIFSELNRRRPLMVGSELTGEFTTSACRTCRRPLMVGSEPSPQFPSPNCPKTSRRPLMVGSEL